MVKQALINFQYELDKLKLAQEHSKQIIMIALRIAYTRSLSSQL